MTSVFLASRSQCDHMKRQNHRVHHLAGVDDRNERQAGYRHHAGGCHREADKRGGKELEMSLTIEMGADAVDIGKTIHPHPTLGESIGMAAEVAHGSCTDLPPARK